jgi:cysteine/O-acetylserine efflux protein
MNVEIIPLISFVIVTTFTPGPNNISSASMGVIYGYKHTLSYLFGIAFGFFLVMLACAYLSSALLNIIPALEEYLRIVGACYILWLAIVTLRTSYSFDKSDSTPKAFIKGFILQFLNPKVAIYGLTLYSTFLSPVSDRLDYLSLSAVAFAATAFIATSTWALFGAAIRNYLQNMHFRKIVNLLLSLLLIYTAIEISGVLSWIS